MNSPQRPVSDRTISTPGHIALTSASVEFRLTVVCLRVIQATAAPFRNTATPVVALAPSCGKSASNEAMSLLR